MKTFAYEPMYSRDQPMFELRVVGLFLFNLLFASNILLQFNSASKIVGIIIALMLPAILMICGIYYYYKIFQLKTINPLDAIILISLILPIYNAITVHMIFDVKLLKAIFNVTPRFYVVMCSIIYYAIRSNKITLKQYVYANLLLCWFCFILYTVISLTIPPATFIGSLGDGLVGFNPSKGGYIYRFSSAVLIFGMIYYFLDYIMNTNYKSLLLWGILMAYQVFIDKGRTELVSEAIPMFAFMFFILKWHEIAKKLFTIFVLICITLLIAYWIDPKIVQFTADMYWMFIKFFLGKKTGEGSADMRWTEMSAVYHYFLEHPGHLFFGIGCPKKEIMQANVGMVILGDIGIVGGLLSQGIIGLVAIYSVFLYPIFVWFNVKHYKKNLVFNAGMLGIATVFIQSLFNGGIFYSFLGIMAPLIIVEYYRVKEKVYWRRLRANQNNIEQKV